MSRPYIIESAFEGTGTIAAFAHSNEYVARHDIDKTAAGLESYSWSCTGDRTFTQCHGLLERELTAGNIGHMSIRLSVGSDEAGARLGTEEALGYLNDPANDTTIEQLMCRFLTGITLSISKSPEPWGDVIIFPRARYGGPPNPSVSELLSMSGSANVRAFAEPILEDLGTTPSQTPPRRSHLSLVRDNKDGH